MRVCFLWVAFTLAFVLLVPGPSRAEGQGFTTLDVNGEQVTATSSACLISSPTPTTACSWAMGT